MGRRGAVVDEGRHMDTKNYSGGEIKTRETTIRPGRAMSGRSSSQSLTLRVAENTATN